jgi:hypothetical protein
MVRRWWRHYTIPSNLSIGSEVLMGAVLGVALFVFVVGGLLSVFYLAMEDEQWARDRVPPVRSTLQRISSGRLVELHRNQDVIADRNAMISLVRLERRRLIRCEFTPAADDSDKVPAKAEDIELTKAGVAELERLSFRNKLAQLPWPKALLGLGGLIGASVLSGFILELIKHALDW